MTLRALKDPVVTAQIVERLPFLGLDAAHTALGSIQNAPVAIRADQLVINQGGGANHILYVQCPVAPFLNSTVQDACTGK